MAFDEVDAAKITDHLAANPPAQHEGESRISRRHGETMNPL